MFKRQDEWGKSFESKDRVGHDVGNVTSVFVIVTLSINIGSRGFWEVFLSLFLFL